MPTTRALPRFAASLPLLGTCLLLLTAPAAWADRPTTPEVWHPTLVQFKPAGEVATEFGCPLSHSGYEKLRAALPWKEGSTRTDYYYDGFDGHRFLLRTSDLPLKVRVKLKHKPHWQVSRFVSKDQVHVGDLAIKIHVTESWEGKLKGKRADALIAATRTFGERLATGGAPLRAAAEGVQAAWVELKAHDDLPGEPVMDHYLAGRAYRLCPIKLTPDKARLSAMLPGDDHPPIKLMLGRAPEHDAAGKEVWIYELEAEPEHPLASAQVRPMAEAIGRVLAKAGLTARDQIEPDTRSWEYTLEQLTR